MHGEDVPRLRQVIGAIHDSGIGALCVESRPHPDFLGQKWCFPTGYAAGKAKDSEYRVQYLREMHADIAEPQTGSSILLNLPVDNRRLPNTDPVVAVVAARRIPGRNMDHSTFLNRMPDPVEHLMDFTDRINGDVVCWDVPEGLWRILIFTAHAGMPTTSASCRALERFKAFS